MDGGETIKTPDLYLNDPARLAVLARTQLPDSKAEASFDRLTRVASVVLGAPVALVSLVDDHRQFFKSCVGLPEPWASDRETPLTHSFCQHVVTTREPLIVEDARLDPRVRENMAVSDLGVIAYLGVPLTVDGHVIGSFCAIDGKPRAWTASDVAVLGDLAESVVTEIRFRAEHAEAEAARLRLQVTLSSIGDAVIATDARGSIVFMNQVAEALCGWSDREASGVGLETVFRIVNEETRLKVENPVARVLASGGVVGLANHTILIARDGTERAIEDSAAPIKNAAGEIDGVVIVFRDATARRRQDRELQDARDRLDSMLSAGNIGTWEYDIVNEVVTADSNLARIYGVAGEGPMRGPIDLYFQIIHPDDHEKIMRAVGRAIESTNYYETDYRLVMSDGSVRWVVARGRVQRDASGRAVRLPGVVVDITDQKVTEAALQDTRLRLENALAAGSVATFTWEIPDDRVAGDANLARFFSLPTEGGGNKPASAYVDSVYAEDRERVSRTLGEAVAEGDAYSAEFRVATGSGAFRWLAARGAVNRDDGGRPVRMTGVVVDVTLKKLAEQEREKLVEQLRDADRRKDEFLAMLAHELRNPLGVISNGVQLVRTVRKPELLVQLRESIEHQVVHLTHLIDDLLDVSRITQGKIELRKQTVELSAVVGRALDLVRPLVDEKQHSLTVSLPEDAVRFVADPTRTEQILGNLLTNAAKYSEPRGSIRVSAAVEGDEVVFKVRDAGDGISAEMLPKVFGLFTQVDPTIDRSRGGLGIGLTLVRSLVEMHGGSVTAASEGKHLGAEFTVRLPVGRPTADDIAAPALKKATRPGGGGRILVVDDNAETVKLTARMLRHYGYEVQTAHDGHEAIELARRLRPDIILLDIGLPGMNGYEVASQLRLEDCSKGARLIAISGYGEEKSRERSKSAGFDHHLIKPVDFEVLTRLLAELTD